MVGKRWMTAKTQRREGFQWLENPHRAALTRIAKTRAQRSQTFQWVEKIVPMPGKYLTTEATEALRVSEVWKCNVGSMSRVSNGWNRLSMRPACFSNGWKQANNESGGLTLYATNNPDSDELNNLGEYALGGDPTNGADIGYLPTSGTVAEGGSNFFECVHARRKDSAGELSYVLESTSDLVSSNWTAGSYVTLPSTGNLDTDYEAVTNRIDTSGKTNEFIRLKVEAL
jgi:hypothetical protein